MKWSEVGGLSCSVARTASVIGDRWTILILRNAFLRIRRFEDFQSNLGITRHLLAGRLKRLVDEGILARVAYQESPPRYEYRLTSKGKLLYPVLIAMATWGDSFMDGGKGAPVLYQHKSCGKIVTPQLACPECGGAMHAHEVTALPGPGLKLADAVGRKKRSA
ncbi:transcriptional regulator [Solimonas sp. K1W22B-7]|uniref:winged helix-turn-helix transcriptional regulator n=1 Tax=Solimonas sp. K1W22B-7 TaxID=2303331 RepID=UPI000E33465A|nr:winged helix-turn-helix transcriptional regulator [Solimonas sp. K1W22B-7]AXQ30179.1 transcriptional regulator [Solimonas sp. K1W22B-7]